jgi:hypothetical protein
MTIDEKLDEILEVLRRMEARQVDTTKMVEEVKEHEQPVQGSFASTDQ